MSDFFLAPDEPDDDRPERSRPVRLVGSGLHPVADLPAKATQGPSQAAVYTPCACGQLVLTGQTDDGRLLRLSPQVPTWCVLWLPGVAMPRLVQSAGYPEHQCMQGA